MIDSIKSYFNSNPSNTGYHKKDDDLLDPDSKGRYTHIFNLLRKKVSKPYADECVIQLTVSTLAFANTIDKFEEFTKSEMLTNQYMEHLKNIFIETDDYGVYDELNYRGYIEF